jgi:hypothetical protein
MEGWVCDVLEEGKEKRSWEGVEKGLLLTRGVGGCGCQRKQMVRLASSCGEASANGNDLGD